MMTAAREIRRGARNRQRPEAEQDSVERREIGRATPRPVDDQELLLHEEAVGDNGSCTTGSQELGDSPQQMGDEDEQVSHDGTE
jgi:hypothetical protein